MSDNIIIHKIEPGDTLESISRKTNIPLNVLWNMKSTKFMDVNNLNPNDQIVLKNGELVYENQLYDQLTQPPSIQNSPSNRQAPTLKNNNQDSYVPTNNSNPNPDCPTGTCKESVEKCLIEVKITPKKGSNKKDFFYQKANENKIPKMIVLASPNPKDKKDIKANIDYEIEGSCNYDQQDLCCHGRLGELRVIGKDKSKLSYNMKNISKSGELADLSFKKELMVFGNIDKETIKPTISPLTDNTMKNWIIHGTTTYSEILKPWKGNLMFLFTSRLYDFPINVHSFEVSECETGSYIKRDHVKTQIISTPFYSQTGKFTLKVANGKFEMEGEYTAQLDNRDIVLTTPPLSIPYLGGIARAVSESRKFRCKVPIKVSLVPPKIEFDFEASLRNSSEGKAIARTGHITAAPILGVQIALDLLGLLSVALKTGGVTGPVALAIDGLNVFDEVVDVQNQDDRFNVLKGTSKWYEFFARARASGYCYLKGKFEVGGQIHFKDSDLFDEEDASMVETKLTATTIIGIYGGLWAEGRIFGFGVGGGLNIDAEVKWQAAYYFTKEQLIGWWEGFSLTIYGEISVGYKREDASNSNGSFKTKNQINKYVSGTAKVDASGFSATGEIKVDLPGGGEEDPIFNWDFKTKDE